MFQTKQNKSYETASDNAATFLIKIIIKTYHKINIINAASYRLL